MPTREQAPADRWVKIDDLFHRALDLPAQQRPNFWGTACGDDRELRREIE